MDDSTNIEIFCSYSHKDERWRELLEKHLFLLKRQERFTMWHDRRIAPGSDWSKEIDEHLETASVILLLISADFIFSDYCYGIEMQRALERHKEGKARVIPILVRSVDWRNAPFVHLQMLPTDLKPIQEVRYKDTAFADVAAGIRRAIDDLERGAQHASLPSDWMLPYFHNPFFLGREDLLARMRECFQSGSTNVLWLTGRKGIGKTRLVVEYIYRNRQDYQKVLWAQATDADMLVSSYIDIARFLKLPEHTIKEQALITNAVKRWLQEHERWLLVLDNAADLPAISDLLQQPLRGHIIITRQKAPGEERGQLLKVDTLSSEQGALLLLRRAGLLVKYEPLGHVEARIQRQAIEAGAEVPEIKTAAASNRHDLCVLPTYRSARL